MRYEDSKLLLAWARLQREIAVSRNPTAEMDLSADLVQHSAGYRKLRAFVVGLSAPKRRRFLVSLQAQLDGVREVFAAAKASGEAMSLADLTITIRDKETDQVIGATLVSEPASCPGAGAGLSAHVLDGNGKPYVKCARCLKRFDPYAIGFKIPAHEAELP